MVQLDTLTTGEKKVYDKARKELWENPLGLVALFCCSCGGWELIRLTGDILPYLQAHRDCGGGY